ncbi:MAG TPA: metal ABC transporter substrate-binding protein [Polyangia bacterium]|jgi:zinc/manganese transport system substrate-binding protein|nr:metal ABC transporter substrate-binding protein [Polyangia bacterium]
MRFGSKLTAIFLAGACLGSARSASAKLRVVASIETLADLCREVGGDRIEVTSLSHGYQDPHFVEAKPSLVLSLNRADALVYVGLDLEIGWLPPLVQQSRNPRIQRGAPGNVDASTGIKVEDVPNIPADQLRALGDIHPLGNPHYWIPPKNARGIARVLAQRFAELDTAGTTAYQAGLAAFEHRLDAKEKEWEKTAAPLRGINVVTYHKSWSYVAEWLQMREIGYIEPKPGIPPTGNHTAQLIELMRKSNVKLVIVESFYPSSLAKFVADNGHARLVSAPSDVGATPAIKTYFDLVDAVVRALVSGL